MHKALPTGSIDDQPESAENLGAVIGRIIVFVGVCIITGGVLTIGRSVSCPNVSTLIPLVLAPAVGICACSFYYYRIRNWFPHCVTQFCAPMHCCAVLCPTLILGLVFVGSADTCSISAGISLIFVSALVVACAFGLAAAHQAYGGRFCETIEQVSYEEILPHLRTGDIVLSVEGGDASWAIMVTTASPWCHAGMIVRNPPREVLTKYYLTHQHLLDPHGIYVLEAEPQIDPYSLDENAMRASGDERPLTSSLFRPFGGGAHLRPFAHYCDGRAHVGIRRIERPPNQVADTEFLHWMLSDDVCRAPYDWSKFANPFFRLQCQEDATSLFCSELVVLGLQHLGVFHKSVVAENFSPHSLLLDPEQLPLEPHVQLHPVYEVVEEPVERFFHRPRGGPPIVKELMGSPPSGGPMMSGPYMQPGGGPMMSAPYVQPGGGPMMPGPYMQAGGMIVPGYPMYPPMDGPYMMS